MGADGSVSTTPVAWSNLAPRGGYFYVHVHSTAPVVVQGASVGPFPACAFASNVFVCLLRESHLHTLFKMWCMQVLSSVSH
ncbi:MAG: hypothetical protein EOO65_05310 [Methanosarcinales archaeon]|nr:MAG: hypothetical protein EOO65_05310 [Methanosarcinales archaeon]